MANKRYYEVVAEELQRRFIRPGLWTEAVAETGGEGDAARAFYIRLRVAELIRIEHEEDACAKAEMERRAADEARAQKERRDADWEAKKEWARKELEQTPSLNPGWWLIGGLFVGGLLAVVVFRCIYSR